MNAPASNRAAVIALWWLAITGLIVGVWALFAPSSFYSDFPIGQGWVGVDGPYNEHLVRDVGGLTLALALATTIALVQRADQRHSALAWGWLIYGIGHFTYHLHHLEPFGTIDKTAVVIATLSTPLLAAVALALQPHSPSGSAPPTEPKRLPQPETTNPVVRGTIRWPQ